MSERVTDAQIQKWLEREVNPCWAPESQLAYKLGRATVALETLLNDRRNFWRKNYRKDIGK